MKTNYKTLVMTALAVVSINFLNAANTTWVWTGANNTNWTTKSNWSTTDNNSSPNDRDTVIINSGSPRYPRLGSNRDVAKLVLNGGSIDLDGDRLTVDYLLEFRGGTFINTGNTDEVRINDAIVDFTGTLSLPNDVRLRIDGNMDFISGIIDNGTRVEFRNNATATGASDVSFFAGEVRKRGNDAFVFPIGKGSVYAPVSISAPSNSGHHFTAEYFNTSYSNTNVNSSLDHVSVVEYWTLDRTNGSSNVNVTLSYENPRSGQITNLTQLRIARYSGGTWSSVGGSTTGNTSVGSISTTSAQNNFGEFTLGSSSALNPLPVKLIEFNSKVILNSVKLEWATSFEVNNKNFEVEKSNDGKIWIKIAEVTAVGNSEVIQKYEVFDFSPVQGVQYYRLKQNDLNGSFTRSEIVFANYETTNKVVLYPNPSSSNLNIKLQTEDGELCNYTIIDQMGKILKKWTSESNVVQNVNIEGYKNGFYTLKVESKGKVSIHTFIKN
ncbi:MAG: T9SS type A sorting domain-containing protein [Bacteroidia bacterium]